MIQLPRLSGAAAEDLIDRFLAAGPANWTGFKPDDLPEAVSFAATGGSRAGCDELIALRKPVWQTAMENGLESGGSRNSRSRFDAELGILFAELPLLATGEALRDDFWTFMGVALAPDVVHWRFGTARQRYLGGVRNTFQRIWLRARVLDRGIKHPRRWQLLSDLTEDALVQITERPSIGADPVLAKAMAEAWLRATAHHGKGAMEPVMRQAILRVRIRNEIISLADLPSGMLTGVLDAAFGLPIERVYPASDTQQQPTDIPHRTPEDPIRHVQRAARRIFAEAKRRRWISPKSTAALSALQQGKLELQRSERNALAHLLKMMEAKAVAQEDLAVLCKVLPVLASPLKTRAR